MTIKELCKKTRYCIKCSFKSVCADYALRDDPPSQLNDIDDWDISSSIIKTAKILERGYRDN